MTDFNTKFKLLVDRKAQGRFPLDIDGFFCDLSNECFKIGAVDPDISKAIELNAQLGVIEEVIEHFFVQNDYQGHTDYWLELKAQTIEALDRILDGGGGDE